MTQRRAAVEGHTARSTLVNVLCGEPHGPTRAFSPRQLPTDHEHAVPTREYQSDRPSRQPPRPPSGCISEKEDS